MTIETPQRLRKRFFAIEEAEPGMALGMPANVYQQGILRFSLPAGHALTADNLRQLQAKGAQYVCIAEPDERSEEEIAAAIAQAERRLAAIFAGADLADPQLASLYDAILAYRRAS